MALIQKSFRGNMFLAPTAHAFRRRFLWATATLPESLDVDLSRQGTQVGRHVGRSREGKLASPARRGNGDHHTPDFAALQPRLLTFCRPRPFVGQFAHPRPFIDAQNGNAPRDLRLGVKTGTR
jgi:hypothetical protein